MVDGGWYDKMAFISLFSAWLSPAILAPFSFLFTAPSGVIPAAVPQRPTQSNRLSGYQTHPGTASH